MKILRFIVLGWAGILLTFGAFRLMAPHARYASSVPEAGAKVEKAPPEVEIVFTRPLDSSSSMRVERARHADGTLDPLFTMVARVQAADTTRNVLRAQPTEPLGKGVYRVAWRITTAGEGDSYFGDYYFGVGMDVPADYVSAPGEPRMEKDARRRRDRYLLASGVIFLILAMVVSARRS